VLLNCGKIEKIEESPVKQKEGGGITQVGGGFDALGCRGVRYSHKTKGDGLACGGGGRSGIRRGANHILVGGGKKKNVTT